MNDNYLAATSSVTAAATSDRQCCNITWHHSWRFGASQAQIRATPAYPDTTTVGLSTTPASQGRMPYNFGPPASWSMSSWKISAETTSGKPIRRKLKKTQL